jgi:hypothetical protein
MKKIHFLVVLLFISFCPYAQVSINTTGANPSSSAMLDISSSNKGLLIPRVALQSTADNTTIPYPATSLLVYNTNAGILGGTGFFYNKGTTVAPHWVSLMSLALPHYEATSTNGAAFAIDNYSSTSSSSAIRGTGGGTGRGVEGLANSGTGVYAKSNTGNALEVNGKLKIAGNGQLPSQGKVLTTDGQGNATWQGAVAFSAVGIRFDSKSIPVNSHTKVRFHAQVYDLGADYNDADAAVHSTFVAPVDGIYHFNAQIHWDYTSASGDDLSQFSLVSMVNGVTTTLSQAIMRFDGEGFTSQNLSIDAKLTAGTQVWVSVFQSTGDNLNLKYDNRNCYFNGHLVVKQ